MYRAPVDGDARARRLRWCCDPPRIRGCQLGANTGLYEPAKLVFVAIAFFDPHIFACICDHPSVVPREAVKARFVAQLLIVELSKLSLAMAAFLKWNSTSLFAIRELGGDSPANFFPGNWLCASRVQIRNAPRDLLLPGAFRVVIHCCVQAVNQRARQIRAFFLGQAQRLLHYLGGSFGHSLSIPRLSDSSFTLSEDRTSARRGPRP